MTRATVTTDVRFAQVPEGLILDRAVSANAVRVWALLQRYAGSIDGTAFPGKTALAAALDASTRSVRNWLAELERAGWIEVERRTDGSGRTTSNRYHLRGTPAGQTGTLFPPGMNDGSPSTVNDGSPSTVNDGSPSIEEREPEEREPEEREPGAQRAELDTRTGRPRNVIWDALVEVAGAPSPNKRGAYGQAAAWLRDQGATPDTIRHVAAAIVAEWGRRACTATSIADHYTRFVGSEVGAVTDTQIRHVDRRRRQAEELAAVEAAEEGRR